MQTQQTTHKRFYKLEGYYLIPHELLHVLAYRLLDKACFYQWGDHQVKSTAKQTQGERLFILLLPTLLCWGLALLFYLIWGLLAFSAHMPPEIYFVAAPKWHWLFAGIAVLLIIYSGTGYRDIRRAWQILSGEEKSQQKPHNPHDRSEDK